MKKLYIGLLALLLSYNVGAVVIQQESSPGVYSTNLHTLYEPQVTFLASAVRTATQTGADQTSVDGVGIIVFCNVTAVPTVETLIVSVQRKDHAGNYTNIAANSAQAAAGLITIVVSPQLTAVAAGVTGHTANNYLSSTWRTLVTHSGGGNWTYSCSSQVMYK